ncbi:DUF3427 domain-containing protein [Metabacillus sp. SLBN-84]
MNPFRPKRKLSQCLNSPHSTPQNSPVQHTSSIHNNFGMQSPGCLFTNGNDYFLFIDLHKEENSINYQDKQINENTFQWQIPNSTTQGSERGKNIIFNASRFESSKVMILKIQFILIH